MADGTIYIDTSIDSNSVEREMQETEKAIKKTEVQLDKLIEKQIRFVETGGNTNSRAFAGMEYDIAQTSSRLDMLRARLTAMRGSQGQAATGTGMLRNAVNLLKSSFVNIGPNIRTVSANLAKSVGGAVIGGFKKLGVVAKNAAKKILGIGKNAKTSRMSMMKMLATSLLIAIAMRALMAIFNGLKDGMNNLAQYSGETNSDLSALKSSLTQLKNSFATAFAPILSVVTPILTGFMNTISNVVTHIGMLMAALTGKGTFTKAIAVQEDYAASLSDTAKETKKVTDYSTGLDEINKASSNDDSKTSKGSVSPSQMFEEVSIGDSIFDLAKTIKQKVAEGDWKGVGSLVAEKVNSIFSNIDTGLLASNLSEIVINALNVVSGFLQGVDWQMLGDKVAKFIAGINWTGLAKALFEAIGSACGAIGGFLLGLIKPAWNSVVDWWFENAYEDGQFTMQGLLDGIWKGICNIGTWIKDNIFTPFINGFKKAFGINSPSTVMKEMGGYLMAGVKNGISAGITGVVNMFSNLKQRIVDIWNGIVSKIKGCVNSIIGAINGMIRGVVSGMNSVIRAINRLSFKIPSWVPGYGGKNFGFNISTISAPQIPYLATGAVIPPNAPFMAVLGDQKRGTNIEAPLDTIKQAVAEVIGTTRTGGGSYTFIGQINRRTLFEEVIEEAKVRQMSNGRNPFELA